MLIGKRATSLTLGEWNCFVRLLRGQPERYMQTRINVPPRCVKTLLKARTGPISLKILMQGRLNEKAITAASSAEVLAETWNIKKQAPFKPSNVKWDALFLGGVAALFATDLRVESSAQHQCWSVPPPSAVSLIGTGVILEDSGVRHKASFLGVFIMSLARVRNIGDQALNGVNG
jgi:hypothetical protein